LTPLKTFLYEQERVADMMTTRAALRLTGPAIDLRTGLTRTVSACTG
jgi:hypothetical protein